MKTNQQLMQEDKNRTKLIFDIKMKPKLITGCNYFKYPVNFMSNEYYIKYEKSHDISLSKYDMDILFYNELNDNVKGMFMRNSNLSRSGLKKRLEELNVYITVYGIELVPKEPKQYFKGFKLK